MHRWFFANEEQICRKPNPEITPISEPEPSISSIDEIPDTEWKFTVKYKGKLCSNEIMAITGNIEILGKWQLQQCVPMVKMEETPDLWSLTINLPRKSEIFYRYLICALSERGRKLLRFWETNKNGRLVGIDDIQELESMDYDRFGICKGVYQVQRGWLASSDISILQFRFQKAPFVLKEQQGENSMYLKLSLLKMKTKGEEGEQSSSSKLCCNLSQHSANQKERFEQSSSKPWAFCEVSNLCGEAKNTLHYQPKYGTSCGPKDILLFHMTLEDISNTAFLIDLYRYPAKASEDIPPYHYGYQHVLPQQLKNSEGTLTLDIMCATKHRPIGSMTLEYLIIKPLYSYDFNLQQTFQIPWKKKKSPLVIGHRGCGKSFWHQGDILRENTLKSFGKAYEHGADFIELDVQLSQDKTPVVYHDFQLYISRKEDLDRQEFDVIKLQLEEDEINFLKPFARTLKSGLIGIPLNKFHYQQLKEVRIHETSLDMPSTSSASSSSESPCPKDNTLNLPFPSLQNILKKLPAKLGFLLDIKWPQRLRTNNNYEDNFCPDLDKNEYVDIILDIVIRHTGNRRIICSSFDPDICSMLRFKQNRYPVMFTIQHSQPNQMKYLDPRGDSLIVASYFSQAMELWGLICGAEDILEHQQEIQNLHKRNTHIFAWGDSARSEQCRRYLKAADVDGIIFDRINHATSEEDLKQTIVLIEMKQNYKKMPLRK
ncbi:glycerophosphocholine phosphodiesterase GPCPD1-like [Musca vetustissima]|uniref:glycerophosphocholine phosphodiesterase GPCPD1-like n=1 Tax=Musca vetustissima TaxID=27455 RepID=UPI002AB641CA|nr:glycerophosphocholine phosphodiesterase GPCPD1-like [Musca vetustissima]